jgi:hypothetical protein
LFLHQDFIAAQFYHRASVWTARKLPASTSHSRQKGAGQVPAPSSLGLAFFSPALKCRPGFLLLRFLLNDFVLRFSSVEAEKGEAFLDFVVPDLVKIGVDGTRSYSLVIDLAFFRFSFNYFFISYSCTQSVQ